MANHFCIDSVWIRNETFQNLKYPFFTECFQYIILFIPAALFNIIFGLFIIFKLNHSRRILKVPFDIWFILKLSSTILSSILLFIEIMLDRFLFKSKLEFDSMYTLSYTVLCVTMILVAILIEIRRRTLHPVCPILFIFWFSMSVAYSLRFYSNVLRLVCITPFEKNIKFICLSAAILLLFFSNLIMDSWSHFKKDRLVIKKTKPCPEEYAPILSKLTFSWLNKFIYRWFRKEMTDETAFDLRREDECKKNTDLLEKEFLRRIGFVKHDEKNNNKRDVIFSSKNSEDSEKQVADSKKKNPGLILFLSLVKIYYPELIMAWAFRIANDISILSMPCLFKILLQYVDNKDSSSWFGYSLAVVFLVCGVIGSVSENMCYFICSSASIKVRAAIMGMIYRKTLRLSNEIRGKFTSGETVNLMSVDSERIMNWVVYSWFVVSNPFIITVAIILLYHLMSGAIFAGIAVMVAFFPLHGVLMRFIEKFSTIELKWKDKRIKVITEILNGIKVLKMYAWEKSFLEKVSSLRDMEMRYVLRASAGWGIFSLVWQILPFVITLATFITFIVMDTTNIITAEKAFVSLTLFNLLRSSMIILPWGIIQTINAFVSMKRIGAYLVGEELDITDDGRHYDTSVLEHSNGMAIEIHGGCFAWKKEEKIILNKIDFEVEKGKFIAVVGKVGTGKSSLISAILGEMNKINGSLRINGKLAYVSQEAWIQNKSLKDNILFTEKYDETFYNKVLEACSLKPDLEQLPAGDATEIGERGINLSGGQKQRVSLARAVYQNRDIYLLDDPLSAVDAHVGQHLFDNVISNNGILQGKTRILVTHGLNWLPKVDEVFVLDSNGSISERGSYQELSDRGDEFIQIVHAHMEYNDHHLANMSSASEDNSNIEIKNNCKPDLENEQDVNESTKLLDTIPMTRNSSGLSIREDIDFNSPNCNDNNSIQLKSMRSSDFHLEKLSNKGDTQDVDELKENLLQKPKGQLIDEENTMTGAVTMGTYITYIKSRGLAICILTCFMYIVFICLQIYTNVLLKNLIEDRIIRNASFSIQVNFSSIPEFSTFVSHRTKEYIIRYSYVGGIMFFILLLYFTGFTFGTVRAAKVIHKILLQTILRGSLQFFDTTPSGRIISRFTKDMELVDHMIPLNINDLLICFISVLASIAVIIYATPWFTAVIVPLAVIYYFIQRFFMPSSRQSRRLDSVAASPIVNNFTETLQGVSVIRAYSQQKYFQTVNQNLIDRSTKFKFIQFAAIRWFSLRVNIIGSIVVFSAVIFAIIDRVFLTASMVGLSISYSLQITDNFNWFLKQYTELETNSVAIERIREYFGISCEAEWDVDHSLPESWPSSGNVDFTDYDLRYQNDLPLVLKGINLHLNGGEKVGVVGRTGAGKSSLSLALFRLVEASYGIIKIDDIDISTLGLHSLRNSLTILPQDPFIFSGTIRENLDPFKKHTENELFQSLETAHLKEWVSNLSKGIDYECEEGGSNLSGGQKQLLCLARALLRKSKVLILDEATASVDVETDRLVMQTIRDSFRSSTVIIIAHRINTILDSDKIVVMDNGCIIEMDTPQNLLANPGSLFKSLVEQGSDN